MNNQELAVLEKDLKDVENKLDSHISIYVQNGKEIAKNNQLIQEHIRLDNERWEMVKPALIFYEQQQKDWEYIRPMVKDYEAFITGGKILKAIVYFVLIFGSAITVWYKLFK